MNAQTCSEHCPLCDADALDCLTRSRDFDKDGVQFHVDGLEYAVCGECGATTVMLDQSKRNKRRIIAAHKAAAGLLTGDEIAAIRKRRLGGVSQQTMAAVLGVGVNTFSRYETDAVVQSDAMNSLLIALDAHPEVFQTLAKRRGVMVVEPKSQSSQLREAYFESLRRFISKLPTHYENDHTEVLKARFAPAGGEIVRRQTSGYASKSEEVVHG